MQTYQQNKRQKITDQGIGITENGDIRRQEY